MGHRKRTSLSFRILQSVSIPAPQQRHVGEYVYVCETPTTYDTPAFHQHQQPAQKKFYKHPSRAKITRPDERLHHKHPGTLYIKTSPQIFMGVASCRRHGWSRSTSRATRQSDRMSSSGRLTCAFGPWPLGGTTKEITNEPHSSSRRSDA